jgi:hypothetical protein
MGAEAFGLIPGRAETLGILRLMTEGHPMLMLGGKPRDFGTRWVLDGQQVQPAIASYLIEGGYIRATGRTEFGAIVLEMTPSGVGFRQAGQRWWASLNLLQKLRVLFFG